MASSTLNERVARLDENTKNINIKLTKIEDKLDQALFNFDNKYVTRREFAISKWLVGLGITVLMSTIGIIQFLHDNGL